jgi:hypothetical protein
VSRRSRRRHTTPVGDEGRSTGHGRWHVRLTLKHEDIGRRARAQIVARIERDVDDPAFPLIDEEPACAPRSGPIQQPIEEEAEQRHRRRLSLGQRFGRTVVCMWPVIGPIQGSKLRRTPRRMRKHMRRRPRALEACARRATRRWPPTKSAGWPMATLPRGPIDRNRRRGRPRSRSGRRPQLAASC